MASLYPKGKYIGLEEAGEIIEGTIEGIRGDLILLTRTRGLALSIMDQSGNRGYGMRTDCEKRNTAQLQGWDVYEFVPEAITSMEALNIIKEALRLKQRNRDSTKRGAFCAKQL